MRDEQRVHLIVPHLFHELEQPAIDQRSHNRLWFFLLPHRHAEVGLTVAREFIRALCATSKKDDDGERRLIARK